jgi:hypothetical protein
MYGSKENADYIRKHGHGAPWRYRYKVLEVRPHAVRLEIPKDGSVPRVLEWQSMRRVSAAHDHVHAPTGYEPYMTEYGLTIDKPGDGGPTDDDLDDVDTYEIEDIVRADRIGRDYKLWIKWKDHPQITPRWRSELLKETSNSDILTAIKRVVAEAKLRADVSQGHLDEEDETVDDNTSDRDHNHDDDADFTAPSQPNISASASDLPIAMRLPLRRTRNKTVNLAQAQLVHAFLCDVAFSSLTAFQASQCDPICA